MWKAHGNPVVDRFALNWNTFLEDKLLKCSLLWTECHLRAYARNIIRNNIQTCNLCYGKAQNYEHKSDLSSLINFHLLHPVEVV